MKFKYLFKDESIANRLIMVLINYLSYLLFSLQCNDVLCIVVIAFWCNVQRMI